MLLVFDHKEKVGVWAVAWTWLPFFLAADGELVKQVDQELTARFSGQKVETPGERLALAGRMHEVVIELIIKKYPIPGLDRYLGAIGEVRNGNVATRAVD